MTEPRKEETPSSRNTVERILADLDGVHATITSVDGVVGPHYAVALAEQLKAILDHADPSLRGFNAAVDPAQRRDVVWTQLAGACQEVTLAWNLNRLASPAGAKRCLRVALEYFSVGVLEGIPHAVVQECWKEMPKGGVPVWEMVFPKGWRSCEDLGLPLVPSHRFPHGLIAVLSRFPGWGLAEVGQLKAYLKESLHPFAHGSAEALGQMLRSTSVENPSMGIRFESDHTEMYTIVAEEIVKFSAMCRNILNCATSFLESE